MAGSGPARRLSHPIAQTVACADGPGCLGGVVRDPAPRRAAHHPTLRLVRGDRRRAVQHRSARPVPAGHRPSIRRRLEPVGHRRRPGNDWRQRRSRWQPRISLPAQRFGSIIPGGACRHDYVRATSNEEALLVDPEGLVVAPDGHLIVSCEGFGQAEPRIPPSIIEFGARGEYLRRIAVRDRFIPNPTGALTKGVRPNFGFEALTLTPDGSRLFTAAETALVQDGEATTVEHGTMTRLLEYRRHGGTYVPDKEFVYPIEPVFTPPFEMSLAVKGLVELIALGGGRLLAMERTYVEEAGDTGRGLNKIRLFRIDLAGATDVSSVESLKDATGLVPVTKTPFLDLSDLAGAEPRSRTGARQLRRHGVRPASAGRPPVARARQRRQLQCTAANVVSDARNRKIIGVDSRQSS